MFMEGEISPIEPLKLPNEDSRMLKNWVFVTHVEMPLEGKIVALVGEKFGYNSDSLWIRCLKGGQ